MYTHTSLSKVSIPVGESRLPIYYKVTCWACTNLPSNDISIASVVFSVLTLVQNRRRSRYVRLQRVGLLKVHFMYALRADDAN